VIATDMAGAAELVTPRNGLVVPAADPAALAEALRWCLDNRDALQDMRVEALETARRHQWADYRRDLAATLASRLRRLGYDSPAAEAPAPIGATAPLAHGR
jgi:glycosyltransferase involved in cell wall biosynthesis